MEGSVCLLGNGWRGDERRQREGVEGTEGRKEGRGARGRVRSTWDSSGRGDEVWWWGVLRERFVYPAYHTDSSR